MRALVEFWPFLLAMIGALGGAGYFARLAAARAWLRDFLARLKDERRAVVLEVEQTYVDARLRAKRPDSPGGVELTKEEQREALDRAVSRFLELVGLGALLRALRLLGLPRSGDFIRRYAVTHVEMALKELSIEQVAAESGNAPAVVPSEFADTKPLPPLPLAPTRDR